MKIENVNQENKFFLPKSLTTVTKLSKLVALSLFIILPFIGFYIGLNYRLDAQSTINSVEENTELKECNSKFKAAVRGTVLNNGTVTVLQNIEQQKIFIPKLKDKELILNNYWYKGIIISNWSFIDAETNIEYGIWHNKLENDYEETYSITTEDYYQIGNKIKAIYSLTNDHTINRISDEIELAESEIKTDNQNVFYEIPTYTALGISEVRLVSIISTGIGLDSIYVEIKKPVEGYPTNKTDYNYKKVLNELVEEAKSVSVRE